MARISRPQEQLGAASTRPLSVGGTLSAGFSGTSLGQIQKATGDEIVRQGIKTLEDNKRATQEAMFSNATNEATLSFSKLALQRRNSKTDKNGNPTFGTLSEDIGKIGQDVIKEQMKTITDPGVRAKFQQEFGRFVNNQQILSLSQARRQQTNFSRASLANGIQGAINQAAQDSPDNIGEYIGRVNSSVDAQLASGAITASTANRLKKNGIATIKDNSIKASIETDPEGTLKDLQDFELDIDEDNRQKLVRIAKAAVRDKQVTERRAEREQQRILDTEQNSAEGEIELAIIEGEATEAIIEEQASENKISAEQRNNLLQKLARAQKREDKSADVNEGISSRIQSGALLQDFTPKQVSDHYADTVKTISMDPETGEQRPVSMTQKAEIASNYKAKIRPFVAELNYGLKTGNAQQAEEALKSYQLMSKKNPTGLASMDRESQAIATIAARRVEFSDITYEEAMSDARNIVLDLDPAVKQFRGKEFNKVKKFKGDRIDTTITEIIGEDAFLGFGGVAVEPNVSAITRNLLKDAYLLTGNEEDAIDMVRTQSGPFLGVTQFNETAGFVDDEETLMYFPPEKVLPGIKFEVMHKDMLDTVDQFLPPGTDKKNIGIESDELTRNQDLGASYLVFIKQEDGTRDVLLDPVTKKQVRWQPNYATLRSKQEEEVIARAKSEREQTAAGVHKLKGI